MPLLAPFVLLFGSRRMLKQKLHRSPQIHVVRRRNVSAFTLMEVVVAATLLAIICVAATQAIAITNRRAASSRLMMTARTVVERNIARALNSPFTVSQVPPMLATTAASGVTFDDDGNGDNLVNLMVQDSGGPTIITATLTRIVTAVSNAENADIRQVTFRIDYTFRGRPYSYQMSTVRARG